MFLFGDLKERRLGRRIASITFLLFLLCQLGSHLLPESHDHHHAEESSSSISHLDQRAEDKDCDPQSICDEDSRDSDRLPTAVDEGNHHDILYSSTRFEFLRVSKSINRVPSSIAVYTFQTLRPPYLPPQA
jgi:hypothetical protein